MAIYLSEDWTAEVDQHLDLRRALAKLDDPVDLIIIHRRFSEDETWDEIASCMGLTTRIVRRRFDRIRKKLEAYLSE